MERRVPAGNSAPVSLDSSSLCWKSFKEWSWGHSGSAKVLGVRSYPTSAYELALA